MPAIKRTPADAWFSKCVRARARFCCERCGAQHDENSQGLHASHHHGRGNWSIRFNPLNAEALCYGCHSLVGGTEERRAEVLTEQERDVLFELKADTSLGREYRKTKGKGAISKHYKEEYEKIISGEGYNFVAFI